MSTIHDEHDAPKKLDLRLWARIIAHLRPYRGDCVILGTAGMTIALVETTLPWLTGSIIDTAISEGSTRRIAWLLLAYLACAVSFAVLVRLFIAAAGRLVTGVAHDLRDEGFRHLHELPFTWFDRRPTGWLVTRLTSDVRKIAGILPWFLLDIFWGTTMLVGICVALLAIQFELALWVLLIVPPLVIASVVFKRLMLHSSREVRRTNSEITASISEALAGQTTTKSLAREERNLDEFRSLTARMQSWSVRNALQGAVYLPLVASLGSVGVAIALWRGGSSIEAETGLTIGMLVAFMQYAVLFSMPIQELAQRFADLQSAQAAAERVQQLLDEAPMIADSPEVAARIESQRSTPIAGRASDGGDPRIDELQFDHVGFRYEGGERVLDDFELRIVRPQTIALVGPTGGGKSTIVHLLARFYEPTSGSIRVNGVDTRERGLRWWQSQFGFVQQVAHLFDDTVLENVRYGRLDATDAEVMEALDRVGARTFVDALDGGASFRVGEGGARLSTGQRQLLTLARALLADPQVFVLDEATSSIDAETERAIQHAIDELLHDRIALVIAHRLSTIRHADRILFIEAGRIVESGTHDELMRRGGRYHGLYTGQFVAESLA